LRANVVEANIETSMHLLAHCRRYADATRVGQGLEARCHIDAIASDVVAVYDDVAQVETDAELNALIGRLRLIVCPHSPLYVNCATKCSVRAVEFKEHPVTGGLDDPAAELTNLGIDDALANLPQSGERSSLVTLHVSAEADYIGDQDRRKSAGNGNPVHGPSLTVNNDIGQT
jgi:hypothetical protein